MRLPERFWTASTDEIHIEGENRDKIARYIDQLPDAMNRGLGLMLWGPNGRGKTAIAALVAKEAARWGYGCMFIRAADLVDRQFGKAVFDKDDGITVRARARTVSLLVLDDLGKEHRDQHGFTVAEMEEFMRERISRRLVTVITTNMIPRDMGEVYKPSMLEVMKESIYPLKCDGPDLRDEKRAAAAGFLEDVGAGDA